MTNSPHGVMRNSPKLRENACVFNLFYTYSIIENEMNLYEHLFSCEDKYTKIIVSQPNTYNKRIVYMDIYGCYQSIEQFETIKDILDDAISTIRTIAKETVQTIIFYDHTMFYCMKREGKMSEAYFLNRGTYYFIEQLSCSFYYQNTTLLPFIKRDYKRMKKIYNTSKNIHVKKYQSMYQYMNQHEKQSFTDEERTEMKHIMSILPQHKTYKNFLQSYSFIHPNVHCHFLWHMKVYMNIVSFIECLPHVYVHKIK
jgi:hypothetical protein